MSSNPLRSTRSSPMAHAPRPHALPQPRRVTARAIVLGLALTPLNAVWVIRMEEVMFGPYPSLISLFANVVSLLFALVGLNRLLHRLAPRRAFSQGELLTAYLILSISTCMAGQSGLNIVCGIIPHGAWFATPENGWRSFLGSFPGWLVISDRRIARGHFLGNSSFYRLEVLRAWAVPILAWTLLFLLVWWVAYCINVLVRRQWADRERLTFPIVWLPIEMTEGGTGAAFFRNRLMWAGFVVAFGLNLYNGLAFLFPSMRPLPIGIIDLKPYIPDKPWNAIDWTPMTLYPLAIGLSYLLPLDLLFSCWFFYLFWKGQMIVSNALAWDRTPDFPFIKEQGFGAVMGLFAFYVWSGRRHYAEIWRKAWRPTNDQRPTTNDDIPILSTQHSDHSTQPVEAMSYRAALFGAGAGLLALMLLCLAAKVAWWVAAGFFALFIPMLVVVTRIRAELGSPIHDFSFMGPDNMMTRALGTASLRQTDLAFLSLSYPLTYARQSDAMPVGLEGMQMAKLRGMEMRRVFWVTVGATVVGALSAFWAYEHQAYQMGTAARWYAGTHFAQESYDRMQNWAAGTLDPRPNTPASLAMGVGLITTLVLLFLRLRFPGFPLHPIGYVVSSAWAINIVWLPMIVAWILKGLTLRYGGLRAYRQFLPFFLGLILGDCVMGCAWGLMSLVLNMRTYNFFGA